MKPFVFADTPLFFDVDKFTMDISTRVSYFILLWNENVI